MNCKFYFCLLIAFATVIACGAGQISRKYRSTIIKFEQIEKGPHVVHLKLTSHRIPFCGGSIVSKNFVLTAAHCVHGMDPDMVTIQFGGTKKDPHGFLAAVTEILFHPQYVPSAPDYDIAVLRVEPPLKLNNDNITSIALSKTEAPEGTLVDVNVSQGVINSNTEATATTEATAATEKSATDESNVTNNPPVTEETTAITEATNITAAPTEKDEAKEAQEVTTQKPSRRILEVKNAQLKVISKKNCTDLYSELFTDRMLCVSYPHRDICRDESGRPLVTAEHRQIGLFSFGFGCARDVQYPGVYTNPASVKDFIDQATSNEATWQ